MAPHRTWSGGSLGLRFRRSVRLFPGLQLDFGLRGLSLAAGPRGGGETAAADPDTTQVGIPGLSFHERLDTPHGGATSGAFEIGRQAHLDERGRLVLTDEAGALIEPRIERVLRREKERDLREWLEARRAEINTDADAILHLHLATPPPDAFALPRESERESAGGPKAVSAGEPLEAGQEAGPVLPTEAELDEGHERLEHAFRSIRWARETAVNFELAATGTTLHLDVDLPEPADLPTRVAQVAARGLKLDLHERAPAEAKKLYLTHVHAILFRLIGESFAALPALERVVASACSRRVDPASDAERNDYLISVAVAREEWSRLDFTHLAQLDLVACFSNFDLRRDATVAGEFHPIRPIEPDAAAPADDSGTSAAAAQDRSAPE